jgi:hypothetical protein
MLYLASSPDTDASPNNIPFILKEDGRMAFLIPDKNKFESLEMKFLYDYPLFRPECLSLQSPSI